MKKIVMAAAMILSAACVFAYNPPMGGEDLFRLPNPTMLAGGASATGGPFYEIIPESIAFNPALTASEQRKTINASASIFVDSESVNNKTNLGWGLEAGAIFPNKWAIVTVAAEGLFIQNPLLDVGNEVVARVGLSKEITENILIGLNGYFGYFFGDGTDFIAGADLGFLYKTERLGKLKNARIGVSLLNMGKPLSGDYDVVGLNGKKDGTSFPGIFTPRLSFASDLFSVGDFRNRFTGAFSVDASFPTFQNAVFDMAFGMSYNNMINLTVGWNANVREIASSKKLNWPSVGLGVRIIIETGDSKDTWEQNEIIPAVAWQNLYNGIHDVSFGATAYIGMTDDEAPEIYLWGEKLDYDSDDSSN